MAHALCNKKVFVAILILARRHFLSDYLLTDHAIEGALIIVIFFAIFIIIIIMLIIVYCYHPLTDHVVECGVVAAGEEVGEEVHHHQPVLLSLAIMNYHEDDEDVDDYHQHEHDAEQF